MALKPARQCNGYGPRRGGCPNKITGQERYCLDCQEFVKKKIRAYDKERDQEPGRRFLHTRLWRRIRDAKLAKDPLCERCLKNNTTKAATLVHHKNRNELCNSPGNHESLCNDCHEIEHQYDRWGRKGPEE